MSTAELVAALATHGVTLVLGDEGHLRARGRRAKVPAALLDELHRRKLEVAAYLAATTPIAERPDTDLLVRRGRAANDWDAAYRGVQQHEATCPRCAASGYCGERRRLDDEYHARWEELQDARAACGDGPQSLRADREPGDDDEDVPLPDRTSDSERSGTDTTTGSAAAPSDDVLRDTGQAGQPYKSAEHSASS